jgi:hypothetical protein
MMCVIDVMNVKLNRMLIEKFPNLQDEYFKEIYWQEGDATGSHTVFGDVFTPYLVDRILNDYKEEVKIAFDFLEELLKMNDEYVDEVVYFSVLESIAYLFKEKAYLTALLGEKCRIILGEIT